MRAPDRHCFEFGAFRVEVEERRILHDGRLVPLTAKAFDVLVILLQNRGRTVNKDDLIQSVWADTYVEEGNLNHHIAALRRTLGDDRKQQRFIKTIPKRGYRFTAEVREFVETEEQIALKTTSRSKLVIREETTEGFWTTTRLVIAGMFVFVFLGVGWLGLSNNAVSGRIANETRRVEAEDLYRKGRELWQTRDANDLHNATTLLEQAVRLAPDLAAAHAALADAYAFDYANWPRAGAEAREAIRLDPAKGEPYATLGFVRMFWEWRVADAEVEFKQAVSLSPNYATGRQWYAVNLIAQGRGDAALVEIERAAALDPLSVPIRVDRCRILYFTEKTEAAETVCREALAMAPATIEARELLFQIAITNGRYKDAAAIFAEMCSLSKSDRIREEGPSVARAFETGGPEGLMSELIHFYSSVDASFYKLARVYNEMGEHETAVAKLRESVIVRDFDLVYFEGDPAFRTIRSGSTRHVIPGRPE